MGPNAEKESEYNYKSQLCRTIDTLCCFRFQI